MPGILLRRVISVAIAITLITLSGSTISAVAQTGDGVKRQVNAQSRRISLIGPESGRVLSASKALDTFARPQDPAFALASRYAPEFGLKNPTRDLTEMKSVRSDDGRVTVRYQQTYQGIPVMGGELIVNTNDNGDLYSMNGEVSPDISLQVQPTIDPALAAETALQVIAKWYQKETTDFGASEPELWIYDESLLRPSTRPVELVWRMEVTAKELGLPVRELVLVDAQRGNVSLHFNQIDTAWHSSSTTDRVGTYSQPENSKAMVLGSPIVSTYTANHVYLDLGISSGSFLCNQTQPDCTQGDNIDADSAHKYALGIYDFYATSHLRDSINNAGMTIISTVDYGSNYANAFWNGAQMAYGDAYGFALADDVVAHELTHGVTQYESNLLYYYQSGAINESFSDLWGEYYDQTNGLDVIAGIDWRIGEDIDGWENAPPLPEKGLRDMSDPTLFYDPDRMSSAYYYESAGDYGGVHSNSGVNNKAVYLMVDGDTFNEKTVTALGWEKTGAIYYEVQTSLLTSGADYSDLYFSLQQACTNLIGQYGITTGDCVEVKDAVDAVEMNGQPAPNFNTDAPMCDAGQSVETIFYDDLENGTSNWVFDNGNYTRWQVDSSYFGVYSHSGLHSLYADDYPGTVTDAKAQLDAVTIPPGSFLWFAQAYDFDTVTISGVTYYFDGGVLEYSINNDDTWADAGSLIDYNDYNGTIFSGASNPLSVRSAFVGASHGYISTRLNLSSLAGQIVSFRWRMGLDVTDAVRGWWVDDIRIYRCAVTISGNAGIAGATLSYMDGTAKTNTSQADGSYSIQVPPGWSGTVTPSKTGYIFTPASKSYNNVQNNQANQDYVAQVCVNCVNVDVTIGGDPMGSYTIPSTPSKSVNYPNTIGGPVKVKSTSSENIFTSQRAIFGNSFNELTGFPRNQLSTDYWFTYYDDIYMSTWLMIGNPDPDNSAHVEVYIGNGSTPYKIYDIGPGQSILPKYGIAGGPMRVKSTNNVNIFTSQRAAYLGSFNELMGFPANQLTNEYWFTYYDDIYMSTWLMIGNPDPDNSAHVEVYIGNGSTPYKTYDIGPGQSILPKYGIAGGPVRVKSTNSVNIFTSQRAAYGYSFNELMGFPANQLTTDYWYTYYDDVNMDTWLMIGNPDPDNSAHVEVYIGNGSTPYKIYDIGPGQSILPKYGIAGGPMRVKSTNSVNIFTSERVAYGYSFNELMGFPSNQLTDEYWYTYYDNIYMSTKLMIGAP